MADWKKHKKVCAQRADGSGGPSSSGPASGSGGRRADSSSSSNRVENLDVTIDKPFHRLNEKKWLLDRSERDTFKLLIDTYRMRMEDTYTMDGDADADGMYGGASWSLRSEKAEECVAFGLLREDPNWGGLRGTIEKTDVIEYYRNQVMPMQLRMFEEQIYGRGPGGHNGEMMMQVQMMSEGGNMQSQHLDMGSMFSGMGRR